MLRSVKGFFCFTKLAAESKNMRLLGCKIQQHNNQKVSFLTELEGKGKLADYFSNKTISEFSIEDIYFYLSRKQLFSFTHSIAHLNFILNHNLDYFERFLIAKELNIFSNYFTQNFLIKCFNEHCRTMAPSQLKYCMEILADFEEVGEKLDVIALSHRLTESECLGLDYIEIVFLVIQMGLESSLLNSSECMKKMKELEKEIMRRNPHESLKYIYLIEQIEVEMGITKSEAEQNRRESLIEKMINSQSDEEMEYSVLILKFYPQYTYYIIYERLNYENYMRYLHFIQQSVIKNSNFAIVNHEIPKKVLASIDAEKFYNIIDLRTIIEMDNLSEYGKKIRKYFTRDLACVQGLIKYLDVHDIEDPHLWMDLEESLKVKLRFINKKWDVKAITEEYETFQIFKILARMSKNNLGSTKFWSQSLHFAHDVLIDPELRKEILANSEYQTSFLIFSYEIFCPKVMPEHIEEILKKLTLISLTNNKWTTHELFRLINCLAKSKVGDDELWYAIENKVVTKNYGKHGEPLKNESLKKIVERFAKMKKGSYKFWSKMGRVNGILGEEFWSKIDSKLQKYNNE